MTEIIYKNGVFTAKGHANYGPMGQDIVCAGVSVLCTTLAESLTDCEARLLPGDVEVRFNPNRTNNEVIRVILNGFRLLADSYPQHVKVRVIEQ